MDARQRQVDRKSLLEAEWVVLVGEALVAVGSIVVVIGLIKAFKLLVKENS